MSQFQDVTRRLVAAGSGDAADGSTYFLFTDTQLIFKQWSGKSFVYQTTIAESVRPNSAVAYVLTPSVEFIIYIDTSSKLHAIHFYDESDEWYERPSNITRHEVHPMGNVVACLNQHGDAIVIFQSKKRGLTLFNLNTPDHTTEIPVPALTESPLWASFVKGTLYVFYVSVVDQCLHYVVNEDSTWTDKKWLSQPFKGTAKQFIIEPKRHGEFEAHVLTKEGVLLHVAVNGQWEKLGRADEQGNFISERSVDICCIEAQNDTLTEERRTESLAVDPSIATGSSLSPQGYHTRTSARENELQRLSTIACWSGSDKAISESSVDIETQNDTPTEERRKESLVADTSITDAIGGLLSAQGYLTRTSTREKKLQRTSVTASWSGSLEAISERRRLKGSLAADPPIIDTAGELSVIPLATACRSGSLKAISERSVDICCIEAQNNTLTEERLKELLAADPSIIDAIGGPLSITPLATACWSGSFEAVCLLLDNPYRLADPNALSPHNRTPLYYTISRSPAAHRQEIVSALLDAGAHIDDCYVEDDFNTPLMNAIADTGDKDLIHELVDRGASLTKKNRQGKTAVMLANGTGMEPELQPLKERQLQEARSHSIRKEFVDVLLAIAMLIIAYFNSDFVRDIVGRVVTKLQEMKKEDKDISDN